MYLFFLKRHVQNSTRSHKYYNKQQSFILKYYDFFNNLNFFSQILRDLGFMIPDILHIFLSWMELKDLAKRRGCPPSHLWRDKEVIAAASMVGILWLIAIIIP